jgi:hypothetical protein
VTPSGQSNCTWASSTTDVRALEHAGGSGRVAATWYSSTSFTVDVNFTDGQTHNMELYFVDWDNTTRREQIRIIDATSGTVLDTESLTSSFHNGVYLNWQVSGHLSIKITRTAGPNAVLSGMFFDSASSSQTTPTITWNKPADITYGTALSANQLDATANVPGSFVYSPALGTVLSAGNGQTLSVTFTPTDTTDYTTASGSVVINVLQATPTISWQQPSDIVSGTALSSTQLDATASWTVAGVNGTVAGTFTYTPSAGTVLGVGNNQTLSVTFAPTDSTDYTGASGTTTINVTAATGATAKFLNQDTTTQGTWINTYGNQGYNVIPDKPSYPSYVTVTPSGQSNCTWASSTTDVRALEHAGGSGRVAATWYSSTSFTVDVNFTDGQTHNMELYFVDWDNTTRREQIRISDATSGTVLDTESLTSSFHNGVYLNWQVSGHLVIKITRTAGPNAVLSGLFFDAAPTSSPSSQSSITTGSDAGSPSIAGAATAREPSNRLAIITVAGPSDAVLGALPDGEDSTAPKLGAWIHDLAIQQVAIRGVSGQMNRRWRI